MPGSSESDQLYKICSVIGAPSQQDWPEGHKLAAKIGFKFPQFVPTKLGTLIPNASHEGVDIMERQLKWDPAKRLSVSQLLQHGYFATAAAANPSSREGAATPVTSMPNVQGALPPKVPASAAAPSVGDALPSIGAQGAQGAQVKDFPGNFMMNNLNNFNSTKGSHKDPSQPSTQHGRGTSGTNRTNGGFFGGAGGVIGSANKAATPGFGGGLGAAGGLPPLGAARGLDGVGKAQDPLGPIIGPRASDGSSGVRSGGKGNQDMGGSRYLRMARYHPGMEQLPTPQGGVGNKPRQLQGPGLLPDVGPQAHGPGMGRPSVFGANAARMFAK